MKDKDTAGIIPVRTSSTTTCTDEVEPHLDQHHHHHHPTAIQGILNLAIQNNAPIQVIRTILRINADAAAVPRHGPSALQLSLHYNSPIEVVKELIEACPDALSARNGSYDPLSYAKIWRSQDKDLIKLLEMQTFACELEVNKVLDESATPKSRGGGGGGGGGGYYCPWERTTRHVSEMKERSPVSPLSSSSDSERSRGNKSSVLTTEETSELASLKLITAALIRAQKRHRADLIRLRAEVEEEVNDRLEQDEANKSRLGVLETNVGHFCKLVAEAINGLVDRQEALERRLGRGDVGISCVREDESRDRNRWKPRNSWLRSVWSIYTRSSWFFRRRPTKCSFQTEIDSVQDGVEVSIKADSGMSGSPMSAESGKAATLLTSSTASLQTNELSPYFYPTEADESSADFDHTPLVASSTRACRRPRRRWLLGRWCQRKKKRTTNHYPIRRRHYFRGKKHVTSCDV